jgi:nucleoside-diphosphate-sugar epimerase
MKILLTGSTGYLGTQIIKSLSGISYLDKLSRNNADFNIDLSKNIPVFNDVYDLVIHAAGKAHYIPKTKNEKISFYKTNVIATKNLLAGLTFSLPIRFVFISSVSVYGLITGNEIKETCSLLAKDPYGICKIESEAIVAKWCEEHNVICTILRLPLIVGINPPGNLGAMIRGIKYNYYFNIAGGNAKKSMVLASDVAKFVLRAAEVGGIYNLTDGIHPTFKDLSLKISHQLGKSIVLNLPSSIAYILAKFGDLFDFSFPLNSNKLSKITSTLTFDDTKAREAFGWSPTPVLEGFRINKE